jgi:hypothetical protein
MCGDGPLTHLFGNSPMIIRLSAAIFTIALTTAALLQDADGAVSVRNAALDAQKQAPDTGTASGIPAVGAPGCPWPSESGQRLLDRHLGGSLDLSNLSVSSVVKRLVVTNHVPLSFIEGEPYPTVTIKTQDATVAGLLDGIVSQVSGYRYGFIGPRLVLYSTDAKWQARVEKLKLAPGPRRWVSEALVAELRHRFPALAGLNPPWTAGNPADYVYQDEVAASAPASVAELLTQILGNRVSATFWVSKMGGAVTFLRLASADLVQTVQITAPTTTLRHTGEIVQVKVVGMLRDGGRQIVTPAACGTQYFVSNPKVLAVSPDGQVSALASGEARVNVVNENSADSITFTVITGRSPAPGATP